MEEREKNDVGEKLIGKSSTGNFKSLFKEVFSASGFNVSASGHNMLNVLAQRGLNENPFALAIALNNTQKVLEYINQERAIVNALICGYSPLGLAAYCGSYETVIILIQAGADVNKKMIQEIKRRLFTGLLV